MISKSEMIDWTGNSGNISNYHFQEKVNFYLTTKSQVPETTEPAHGAAGRRVAQVSPRQLLLQQLRSQVADVAGGLARPQPEPPPRHPPPPGQRALGRSQVHRETRTGHFHTSESHEMITNGPRPGPGSRVGLRMGWHFWAARVSGF